MLQEPPDWQMVRARIATLRPPAWFARCQAALARRLRLEHREIGLAAQPHDAHLVGAIDRQDHLRPAVALVERDVANFGPAHRQFEYGPPRTARVVFDDLVVGPQIAP